MKIGIALSGGGLRAAGFHLGVLLRLAVDGLLEQVTFVSTVSGGSLGTGLVYHFSDYVWPSSDVFIEKILPLVQHTLTTKDFIKVFKFESFMRPWTLISSRAKTLAAVFTSVWGIHADLAMIPDEPRWIINATSDETACNWRFMARRMGDTRFGYTADPKFPLTWALAASAAVPIGVGPLVVDTRKFSWFEYASGSTTETIAKSPPFPKVHLWDGALYDNLGVEALFKVGNEAKLRNGVDFLIVSDASPKTEMRQLRSIFSVKRSVHDIPARQVAALRTRVVVDQFEQKTIAGRYLKIGNCCDYILRKSKPAYPCGMSQDEIESVSKIPITTGRLSEQEFQKLVRHGYEVADCTLYAYGPDDFKLRGYPSRRPK